MTEDEERTATEQSCCHPKDDDAHVFLLGNESNPLLEVLPGSLEVEPMVAAPVFGYLRSLQCHSGDDHAADHEGGGIGDEGEVATADCRRLRDPLTDLGGDRPADRPEREGSVGADEAQAVRGNELLLGDEIRNARLAGRLANQGEDLEEERNDEQLEQAVDDDEEQDQDTAAEIGDDHRPLPVEAIRNHASDRPEDPGQQATNQGNDDPGDPTNLVGEGDRGKERYPVAER